MVSSIDLAFLEYSATGSVPYFCIWLHREKGTISILAFWDDWLPPLSRPAVWWAIYSAAGRGQHAGIMTGSCAEVVTGH